MHAFVLKELIDAESRAAATTARASAAGRVGAGRSGAATARRRHRQRLFHPLRIVGVAQHDRLIEHADFARRLGQHDLAAQLAFVLSRRSRRWSPSPARRRP
jgi:hypothetical protein